MNDQETEQHINPKIKSFLLAAITLSLSTWDLSFNLGAFKVIFFEKIFLIWVASSATLLACLLLPRNHSPIKWPGLLLMSIPTLWFILPFVPFQEISTTGALRKIVSLGLGIVVYLICLPYTLYMVFAIINQDIVQLSKKLIIKLITILLIIGYIGYFVGSHNYLFLSCFDFKVSGNDLPTNCLQESYKPLRRFSGKSDKN
ncbi:MULTISPECIES: hypothetical protein [unclassified Nostoc]|uniref:hypothetical protein n=1 Tax=unclassified Nostoc TaxID=2593658 RepID=UPI002AD223BE|nr:hypothetical protein [Nostoc sp. ChiQUE02]MDZ8230405.1 hypothetical protein [Nostoc sp. ChiQUE02]